MSFSQDIKTELARQIPKSRHCRIAELAAIIIFLGKCDLGQDREKIQIVTENVSLAKKVFSLFKKCFNVNAQTDIKQSAVLSKNHIYHVTVAGRERVSEIAEELHLGEQDFVNPQIVEKSCCQRAFIRGAFLAAGSMSDPDKSYHLEIVCQSESHANKLVKLIGAFHVEAKVTARKKKYIVYIKDSTQIVDFLNVVEAHQSLMKLENVKIIKGIRNSANRQFNCDSANINKIVSAAAKQKEDILYIEEHGGLKQLPAGLAETARIRLQYPELSLQELGALLEPPVGKSGVNHRLRRIGAIAAEMRGEPHD